MRTFLSACFLLLLANFGHAENTITKAPFGKLPDGTEVDLFTLKNANGMVVKITNYGGIITEIHVPDRDGKFADVVLGHDNLKSYLDGHPYFGAITGRVANRIAKGKFTLDGKEYTLDTNNGPHALHGGKKGFDKHVWKAEIEEGKFPVLTLSRVSEDGEEGYPGTLQVSVSYVLWDKNQLSIKYTALTNDKATPINLTNHSYFNLKGHGQGDILDHEIEIMADQYTPTDATLIPTGKIEPVKGTPYDFTTRTPIGKNIKQIKAEPAGYDLNYVLREGFKPIANVVEPKSGRTMMVWTSEPGMQFYTGNFLSGKDKGKGGAVYNQYGGFCLETQHFPDSINQKAFPSVVLKPGTPFMSFTNYGFGIAK